MRQGPPGGPQGRGGLHPCRGFRPDGRLLRLRATQSEIFPQIRDGSSVPRGQVAELFGLTPGKPLREQGYPNGIPIEVLNFPGVK